MIKIKLTSVEKEEVVLGLRKAKGSTISVAKFAKGLNMNPNRVRFVIDELIEEGRIEKIITKEFNEHYRRYKYKVIK